MGVYADLGAALTEAALAAPRARVTLVDPVSHAILTCLVVEVISDSLVRVRCGGRRELLVAPSDLRAAPHEAAAP